MSGDIHSQPPTPPTPEELIGSLEAGQVPGLAGREPTDELALARTDLAEATRLLKQAGITRKAIAETAGYSSGYLTQILGERYPVGKLNAMSIGRVVGAASDLYPRASGMLGTESDARLSELMSGLRERFNVERETLARPGDSLPHDRIAANYIVRDADRRLEDRLRSRGGYGAIEVVGESGDGKSWLIQRATQQFVHTHDSIYVSLSSEAGADEPDRAMHALYNQLDRTVARTNRFRMQLEQTEGETVPHVTELSQPVDQQTPVEDMDIGDKLCELMEAQQALDIVQGAHERRPLVIIEDVDHLPDSQVIGHTLKALRHLTQFLPALDRLSVVLVRRPLPSDTLIGGEILVEPFTAREQAKLIAVHQKYRRMPKGQTTDELLEAMASLGGNAYLSSQLIDDLALSKPNY